MKKTGNVHGLDLALVIKELNECHPEKDTILLDHYINTFTEFARFFDAMGKLFSFVSKDVHEKVGILAKHRQSSHGEKFKTMQSMMEYEIKNDLTTSKSAEGLLSGSRTVLRLHRALAFIIGMLRKVDGGSDHDKVSTLAGEAYNDSLAHFHPWLVRKAVGFALYTLPTRKHFMENSFKESPEEAHKILPDLLQISDTVYDEVEQLYTKHDLLMLP
ncbi:ceramide-1-phosphate transfer protein-like [Saccoglossus kowalevskii]|uniref:Ceramide-1-phosphate transfer protein-like n=1 Tax=Saccoglossus kowalevskii TaxID=10224 RepID=A0ABM0M7S2_SACKO|nr:PREDICTED: ceramide-1-phosphate transfer protein-like [Saccoglossus kowalevskii]